MQPLSRKKFLICSSFILTICCTQIGCNPEEKETTPQIVIENPDPTSVAGNGTCETDCDDVSGGNQDNQPSAACQDGEVRDAEGRCVADGVCRDTCQSAGHECGNVCGSDCGECESSESCIGGKCMQATSCADCSMRLSLVERKKTGDRLTEITLVLDYEPHESEPRPRMADLHIRANESVTLTNVAAGNALTDAGKDFFFDEITGKNWKELEDGTFRLLALSLSNSNELAAGRLATLTFSVQTDEAVQFSILRRTQTFAPAAADSALQASAYDSVVMVTP